MPQLYVIFDTNIYRGLSPDACDELRQGEDAADVQAFTSIWPCLELLARCTDADNRERGSTFGALTRLRQHAGYDADDGPHIRMHVDGESTLALGLFGRQPTESLMDHGRVADLVGAAVAMPRDAFLVARASELASFRSHVDAEEVRFVKPFRSITELVNADTRAAFLDALRSSDGLRLTAKTSVTTLASRYGVAITEKDLPAAVDRVLAAYPIAMHFLRDLLVDAINSDMNWTKSENRNSRWDLNLAFHPSAGGRVGNVPVLLVAKDRRLRRAATAAALPHQVVLLEEYTALLTGSGIAERAHLLLAPT